MFSKNKKAKPQVNADGTPVVKPSVPSIMSADLVVTGDIVSEGEVQIDGEVIGDIKGNVLLVGESAHIRGEIYALTIRIHGSVTGQIKAKNVHLAKSARVVGDILHENLSIDEGAFIEGHITHINESIPAVSEDRVNLVVNKVNQAAPVPPAANVATANAVQANPVSTKTTDPKQKVPSVDKKAATAI